MSTEVFLTKIFEAVWELHRVQQDARTIEIPPLGKSKLTAEYTTKGTML